MKKVSLLIMVVFFAMSVWSQNKIPLIGSDAPSFRAKTTNGNLNFPKDFGKSWKILFSHPKDFTPVCTSEILQLAQMQQEFADIDVKIAIISTDVVDQHTNWKKSIEEIVKNGNKTPEIKFPLIADADAKISKSYGMLHEPVSTTKDVRGVFILDEDNVIQSVNFYPMNVGRNMEEIKRVVVALQMSKENQVSIPVNWNPGDDVLVPYKPYTNEQLDADPDLKNKYYNVGNVMWYKKLDQ